MSGLVSLSSLWSYEFLDINDLENLSIPLSEDELYKFIGLISNVLYYAIQLSKCKAIERQTVKLID